MTTKQKSDKKDDDEEDDKPRGGQAQMMQSMTTIMPIMFGFFSMTFSVGLSIYFVTSNLIGIVQYSPQGRKMSWTSYFARSKPTTRRWRSSSKMKSQPKKTRKRRKKKPRKK